MIRLASALAIVAVVSLISSIAGLGAPVAEAACVPLTNNLVVSSSTTFCAGSYAFLDREADGVIKVGASNITIDGAGLTLDGRSKTGYGIYLNGHSGVTIRNFSITRYYHAIRIENASGILVQSATLWNNGGIAQQNYNILRDLAGSYGGGILVNKTTGSTFSGIAGAYDRTNGEISGNQNVGIDVYESSGNTIANSDWSNNYGWGIRLYLSDGNTISGNKANSVHGCRGQYCSSRDTAGILLAQGSDNNVISDNSIQKGGDGFFIGNGSPGSIPSNNNRVLRNDASNAIHNAFEATFSTGNVFDGNTANGSGYGFWLGYSNNSTVRNNKIAGNRFDGINWEHGHDGTIADNVIQNNGYSGIALMIRSATGPRSYNHVVTGNTIQGNAQNGIYVSGTSTSQIGTAGTNKTPGSGNTISGNSVNLSLVGESTGNTATQNNLVCSPGACQYNVNMGTAAGNNLNAENNWWGTTNGTTTASLIYDGADVTGRGLVDYTPWLTAPSPVAP